MREALVQAWGADFLEAADIDFFDDVWVFKEENQIHKIIWNNIYYGNVGGLQVCLTAPENADILSWVKPFFWALLYHPAPRANPKKPAALSHDFTALRTLLYWMSTRKIRYPDQLTRLEVEGYIEELPNLLLADSAATNALDAATEFDREIEEDLDEGLGPSSFYKRLNLLDLIFDHSENFLRAGVKPMPEAPFPNIGVISLAKRLAKKQQGSIPPLQDEIAIPLFNNSATFVTEAFPVIERLVENVKNDAPFESFCSERRSWRSLQCAPILEAMLKFEAERIGVPFMPDELPFMNRLEHPTLRMHVIRAFVRHYISACAILVHGLLGMRASEFLSIRRGVDAESKLPVDVRYEVSVDGLFKVFLLDASLTKMAAGSETATWTVGAMPVDSEELPIAIVAIIRLNNIASLMQFSVKDPGRLFFSFNNNGHNPNTRWRVSSWNTAGRLTRYTKDSIKFFVDIGSLPDESHSAIIENDLKIWKLTSGEVFRPHMMRKTFAQFIYHSDNSLIRGIQLQLQHQSLAMTYGYIGSGQRHSIKSAGEQVLATTVMDIVYGKKTAGRQGRRLVENIEEYSALVGQAKSAHAWVKIQKYNIENNIRLFSNGRHGYCLPVELDEMRCHKIGGTSSSAVLRPNLAHRSPDVCSGCGCFLLMPNKSDFWIRRYRENKRAALQLATKPSGSKLGQASLARNIFEQRAKASALLLDQLGIDVRNLPEEVRNDEKP